MQQNSLNLFIKIVVALIKTLDSIRDQFYSQKFYSYIHECMEEYIKVKSLADLEERNHVAQYIDYKDLLFQVDLILELLDHYEYAGIADTAPLFNARKMILDFKLQILSSNKNEVKPKAEIEIEAVKEKPAKIREPKTELTSGKKRNRGSQSKEEVLNYLKELSSARPRDVVEKFGTVSERTVMRTLKELVEDGLADRYSDEGVIKYRPK